MGFIQRTGLNLTVIDAGVGSVQTQVAIPLSFYPTLLPIGLAVNIVLILVKFILTITNTYNPEKIIIGGGLIDTKDLWWDKLLSKIKESSLNQLFEIQVVPAT